MTLVHPVETYLAGLFSVHGSAVPETTYYPILRDLLDAVGKTLKPRVVCVVHPKDQGAGLRLCTVIVEAAPDRQHSTCTSFRNPGATTP